jgi:restriction system protein
MLPVLEALADGQPHAFRDVVKGLADRLGLTDEERSELLPSGKQLLFPNRVNWAKTYLKKASLLDNSQRGIVQITNEGRKVLASGVKRIDNDFLQQFDSFRDWWEEPAEKKTAQVPVVDVPERTPDEVLESAYLRLRSALVDELLDRIKGCSPQFFERLVVELLVAMGYGGSLADAGRAIGKSGDGGIDGIIKEDELGLDVICIQAKRWENTVGRPVVQGFAGSMEGYRARKGVLITTSAFSSDAKDYVKHIERKIVLIDGQRLAEMMIDHNIGVATARRYDIKRVDADYFVEDD